MSTGLNRRFPHYSRLLRLYPASYQKEYGEQMLQTLADMLDDPDRSKLGVWSRLSFDFPFSLLRQQLIYTGETMAHDMPTYAKTSALIGALLLLPFLGALLANSLDTSLYHHNLYGSWLWHKPILAIWVLWLPLAAAAIGLGSLAALLMQRSRASHTSWLRQLLDVRRTWPLLAVVVLGAGIVGLVQFHDSVHCVTGNPVRELHNPHQTLRCLEQR